MLFLLLVLIPLIPFGSPLIEVQTEKYLDFLLFGL